METVQGKEKESYLLMLQQLEEILLQQQGYLQTAAAVQNCTMRTASCMTRPHFGKPYSIRMQHP